MESTRIAAIAGATALIGFAPLVAAQQPAPSGGDKPDPVAALKQSIGEGTKKLAHSTSGSRRPSSA